MRGSGIIRWPVREARHAQLRSSQMPDQPEAGSHLIYFLTHKSEAAARASFDAFRQDPAWVTAKTASASRRRWIADGERMA